MIIKKLLSIFSVLFTAMLFSIANAEISEPDYIIYGDVERPFGESVSAVNTSVRIEAYRDETLVASYNMGDDRSAEDKYVLRFSVDSVGERLADSVRAGDEVDLFFIFDSETVDLFSISDSETIVETVTIIESRGLAVRLDAIDTDGDGTLDLNDDDDDNDRILNLIDNCRLVKNTDQADFDQDGMGDACDEDDDNDMVLDINDDLPFDPTDSVDTDGDLVGDSTDNCTTISNPDQLNTDQDSLGNACDPDMDDDLVLNEFDNCPVDANFDQDDTDDDDIGDACDVCPTDESNQCQLMCFPLVATARTAVICL
ncbi:MAG: thrombospondin type 3 repeat-containing protein [Arenicella sp.]|nr:thrombospondin type 3 repeat-containing protein [Arenicella sp.]